MPANNGKRKPRASRLDRMEAILEQMGERGQRTDKRLDRLSEREPRLDERIQATQSVELLSRDLREFRNTTKLTFEDTLESIKRFENIAVIHERRLSRLEDAG